MKQLLFLFSLFGFDRMVNSCNYLLTDFYSQPFLQLQSKAVNKKVMIKVSLLSQEKRLPPLGIPPHANRDIGFATVFVSLENRDLKNQTVTIKNIEVHNVSDHKLQSFSFQPKQIELKPLENSVIDIHLTNKTGYSGKDRVKAIITYQIGEEVNKIESEAVEVERD
ncbi:MAG: hypothetical protein ACKO11_05515 [Cuspidothrix sp.]